jgi:predicted MFS family arabinose efflux permease
VFGTLAYLARWGGGRLVDRYGARRLVVPGAVSSLLGLVLLASGNQAWWPVVLAGLLFGLGYGLLATSSQLDMLSRWSIDSFAVPTTAWNIAIDFGVGLGGVFIGLVASAAGYSAAFWVLPVAMAVVLVLILLEPHPERRATGLPT